jgi:hypothetical protein
MNWKNINLEWCTGIYNTHKVDVIQKPDRYWYILVDGKRVNRGPFLAMRWAKQCVEDTIGKIEGTPPDIDFMSEMRGLLEKRSNSARPKGPKLVKLGPASPIRLNT